MSPEATQFLDALTGTIAARSQPTFDQRSLGKPEVFSGKDEDWETWSFLCVPFASLLSDDAEKLMKDGVSVMAAASLEGMSESARATARKLYCVLVPSLCGKALSVAHGIERNNGFAVWRSLVQEYEPVVEGMHTSMLCGLLNPQWTKDGDTRDFREMLQDWENDLAMWERQSGEKLSQNIRIAVVMRHALSDMKTKLRMTMTTIQGSYDRLKTQLLTYLQSGQEFDPTALAMHRSNDSRPSPMEVGAIYQKGKKRKGGGKKAKSDWHSEGGKGEIGKNVKKGGKPSKGANAKSGVSTWFDGECGYCGKRGHKRADCRKRLYNQKNTHRRCHGRDARGDVEHDHDEEHGAHRPVLLRGDRGRRGRGLRRRQAWGCTPTCVCAEPQALVDVGLWQRRPRLQDRVRRRIPEHPRQGARMEVQDMRKEQFGC